MRWFRQANKGLLPGLLLLLWLGIGWLSCIALPVSAQGLPTAPIGEEHAAIKPINEVPPPPQGLAIYVNDYAAFLTPQDEAMLRQRLQSLDEAGIAQVSVLILPDTEQELSDFAFKIMNQWGIQHHRKKDGLLVLVNAQRVRHNLSGNRIFVATGLALEEKLPDAVVGRVLDEKAIPAFDQGNYSGGLTQTVLTLTDILTGDLTLPAPTQRNRRGGEPSWLTIVFIVIFILLFFNNRRGGGGGFYGGGGYFGGGGGGFSGGGFGGGFGGGGDSSGGGGSGR